MAAPTTPIASASDSNTAPTATNPQVAASAEQRLAFPSAPFQAMIQITPSEANKIGQLDPNPHNLPYPHRRKRLPDTNPPDLTGPRGRRLFDGRIHKDAHLIQEGRFYMGPEIDQQHVYLGGKTMSQLHEEMSNRHAMIMASYRFNCDLRRNMKLRKRVEREKAGFVHAGFAVKKRMEEEREAERKRREAQQGGTSQQ